MTPISPDARVVSPTASPEETAAIAAALETFMRATAPTVTAPVQALDPWRGAAILEGVSREPEHDLLHPWINT
jgi:hypothetical protein